MTPLSPIRPFGRDRGDGQAVVTDAGVEEGTVLRVSEPLAERSGPKAHSPSPNTSPHVYEPGETIGQDFAVGRRIAGGMGYVYLGHHLRYRLPMVVKQPRGSGEYLSRLRIEAEAWTRLGLHPHIAYCYWVKEIDGWPFLFIEQVEGSTLKDWIYEGQCWDLAIGLDKAIQIAHGIAHAHAQGMLHRDLKPANVLVNTDGLCKVTDFGLVGSGVLRGPGLATTEAHETRTLAGMGTPAYMPPEQWLDAHALGPEVDIFSLGVCLWEMLCGARPYDSTREPSAPRQIERLRPGLPVTLRTLLRRLVAWEYRERPADIGPVIEELNDIYRELQDSDAPSYRLPLVDPGVDNLNNQGVSYWELGQYDRARDCFERVLEREPGHIQANFNLHRFSVLDTLLHSPDSRQAVLEVLREVLRDVDMCEEEIAERIDQVEENNELAAGFANRLEGHTGQVRSVGFSSEARLLASAGNDRTIRLWDLGTAEELRVLRGHIGDVKSVAFSPDGRFLASGGWDDTVRLWEVGTGHEMYVLEGHGDDVNSVTFAADGRSLASGSDDGTVRLWDVISARQLRVIKVPGNAVLSVAFSLDGTFLITGSAGGGARIWDASDGGERGLLGDQGAWVRAVACSPDGRLLALASDDNSIHLWEVATSREVGCLSGHTNSTLSYF